MKVELRDTEKTYAIVNELNRLGIDAGCVYGIFYGLIEVENTNPLWTPIRFHWKIELTPEEIDEAVPDITAQFMKLEIYKALKERNERQSTDFNMVSGSHTADT